MRFQITAQAAQLIQHAAAFLTNIREFARDIIDLVKLEAKLALASIVSIAVLSVGVLLLLATGWVLLVSSLVAWLAEEWLSLPLSLLVVGLVSTAGAVPLILMIKRHSANLAFKATRRQLGGN